MNGVETVRSPWGKTLAQLAADCTTSVRIMSPFVKSDALDFLLSALSPKVQVHFLSRIVLGHFYRGVSDLVAYRMLLQRNALVFNAQRLHAKIYLFDEETAVVTSGNLTMSGLEHNYEYGLLLREKSLVHQIAADFENLERDEDALSEVTESSLNHIDQMLQNMPTYVEPAPWEPLAAETDAEVLTGETAAIAQALRGWQRLVFQKLNELPQIFSLDQVYNFQHEFEKRYPANKHIPDAIRRELQVLRDRGLIQFLGGGHYKRLWR